jgi:hypothetical protein
MITIVLCLAACGGGDEDVTAGGGGDDPDTPVSDTADTTDTSAPTGETQAVAPEPGVGENVRSRPFDRAEVAADGGSVDVYFYGGVPECYVVDRVDVNRTDPSRIELTLFEAGRPGAEVCIEIAVAYVMTVPLEPAADPAIPVVDGTDGQVKS